jgi:pimeloyl-ACP methyl ester carboxylesterase
MAIVSGKAVTLVADFVTSTDARRGGSDFPLLLNARLCDEGCDKRVAFILCHPAGNFANHYLLPHLQRHGAAALGMTTRYINNELELTMERCVQDLGRGVDFLRDQGYEKIILIGNSGGGSLSCLYQAEAETPTISSFPDGEPFNVGVLSKADAIVLLAPHPGRAQALTEWLDPAIIDERNPHLRDPKLDLFAHRPIPFDREWVRAFRAAQLTRNQRISQAALATIAALRSRPEGPSDQIFVVHGTGADPRFIDLTLDPNGRKARSVELTRRLNEAHLSMGRLGTMRTWLSQWSVEHSRANGPDCLARTTAPVLCIEFEKDEIVFPSYLRRYIEARTDSITTEVMPGATHFMIGLPEQQDQLARRLVIWARELFQ